MAGIYFAESIKRNQSFIGVYCENVANYMLGFCSSRKTAIMGEFVNTRYLYLQSIIFFIDFIRLVLQNSGHFFCADRRQTTFRIRLIMNEIKLIFLTRFFFEKYPTFTIYNINVETFKFLSARYPSIIW